MRVAIQSHIDEYRNADGTFSRCWNGLRSSLAGVDAKLREAVVVALDLQASRTGRGKP